MPSEHAPDNEDIEDGEIAEIDRYGFCGNCGHHVVFISRGHQAPDGGTVSAWDDKVKCTLTPGGGEANAA